MNIGEFLQEMRWRYSLHNDLRHSRKVAALFKNGKRIDPGQASVMIGNSLGSLKNILAELPGEQARARKVESALRWHAQVMSELQGFLSIGPPDPVNRRKWCEQIDQSAGAIRQAMH